MYAVARSKQHLGDDYEPDLDGEFKPNMINSVVFLVGAVQQVTEEVENDSNVSHVERNSKGCDLQVFM